MKQDYWGFEAWMHQALQEAEDAASIGEVPVGAVIVKDDRVLSAAHNLRETSKNAIAHAEVLAIAHACKNLGSWRLSGCTLYVTLEPCPMCAGAIINARIDQVVFGAYDKKAGCCGTLVNLFEESFNHKPIYTGGILEQECAALLRNFFSKLR